MMGEKKTHLVVRDPESKDPESIWELIQEGWEKSGREEIISVEGGPSGDGSGAESLPGSTSIEGPLLDVLRRHAGVGVFPPTGPGGSPEPPPATRRLRFTYTMTMLDGSRHVLNPVWEEDEQ